MIRERLELVAIGLYSRWRRFLEFLQSVWHYYRNATFRKIDIAMLMQYILHNPYSIAREFALLQGEENIYTYGETPLTTMEKIASQCGITHEDTVYELGCGRGRACFWLHCFIRCHVVGIEYNPYFMERANALVQRFALPNIMFRCEDMLKSDYSQASVIYLYGSTFEDDFLSDLTRQLEALPTGAKIITVSYTLTDYIEEPFLELVDFFDVPFTWGTATVYLQRRV